MTFVERVGRLGYAAARGVVARLSLAGRVQELEAELRAEQAARRVAERGAQDTQRKLDMANGTVCQQIEAIRGRDEDLAYMNEAVLAGERERNSLFAERDQALRDAEDLRKCHHEAEAENTELRRQLDERTARHAEVLRVREEELAAALLLPARRSWPDLLDAARRQLGERLVQEIGDATLMAQRDAALRRAASLAEELRQARASLAEQILTMAWVPHGG